MKGQSFICLTLSFPGVFCHVFCVSPERLRSLFCLENMAKGTKQSGAHGFTFRASQDCMCQKLMEHLQHVSLLITELHKKETFFNISIMTSVRA